MVKQILDHGRNSNGIQGAAYAKSMFEELFAPIARAESQKAFMANTVEVKMEEDDSAASPKF